MGGHQHSVPKHLQGELVRNLKEIFSAANEDRDYSIYTRSMDAALDAKVASLFPHFGDIEEGDIIVDAGSGTGLVAERAAQHFHGAKVYALDLSHELAEVAEGNRALMNLVYGDASKHVFPSSSIAVKYYSTSGHEIESFGGSMEEALKNSWKEIRPGGRLIIRDFAKPPPRTVAMRILSNVGNDAPPQGTHMNDIDYNTLSTRALFECFHQEFRGGNAFTFEETEIEGARTILLPAEWAHEFMLRKDYTGNWRQEIKEKYTYWTMEEAREQMERAGFVNVRVLPDPNAYIVNKRWRGKVALFELRNGVIHPLPFPTTHMVATGEKPTVGEEYSSPTGVKKYPILTGVDEHSLLSSIHYNKENGILSVGAHQFLVDPLSDTRGLKKHVFVCAGNPNCVIKVIRSDTPNLHSAFRSFLQIVERQKVLEKYGTPHLRTIDADPEGPPYRYIIQERIPEGALCAADLIQEEKLTEEDTQQITAIVNQYEKGKLWQLDTNPFSWYRLETSDGTTQMTYVSGKIYRYDEQWEFRKVGLLQWIDPHFVKHAREFCAAIPTAREYEKFKEEWVQGSPRTALWKHYLDPAISP